MRAESGKPRLRLRQPHELVGGLLSDGAFGVERGGNGSVGVKGGVKLSANDPRWVLAIRTDEKLDGMLLRPADREVLVRLGRVLGLNAFESNLVIAIVQDQARRGFGPRAAIDTLAFVQIRGRGGSGEINWRVALLTGAAIALECVLFALLV